MLSGIGPTPLPPLGHICGQKNSLPPIKMAWQSKWVSAYIGPSSTRMRPNCSNMVALWKISNPWMVHCISATSAAREGLATSHLGTSRIYQERCPGWATALPDSLWSQKSNEAWWKKFNRVKRPPDASSEVGCGTKMYNHQETLFRIRFWCFEANQK